ncbi:MAG: hypothetical protein RBR09_06865 [Desulfobulbaceae bacterium]|nr:hypothetical protein [Desulfobulbaceae bacterium]MDY0350959.1 hypothetical protein [Desulfobulbaceae bacterium]
MIARTCCIALGIISLVLFFATIGKSSKQTGILNDADDDGLVQIVLSCPCTVGPLGVIAGRSYSEKIRKKALNTLVSKYPDWNWDLVKQKRIKPGMTEHELRLAWGNPHSIQHSGSMDKWIHIRVNRSLIVKNVYVENGRVVSWN